MFKISVTTLVGIVMMCTSGSSMSMISLGDLTTQTESMVKGHEKSLTIDKLYKLLQDNPVEKRAQIEQMFSRLLRELSFDADVAEKMMKECISKNWAEIFYTDVQCTLDCKRGGCRQLSCRLIYELEKIGVKSHLVHVWRQDGTMHFVVLYKLGDELCVADLGGALQVRADIKDIKGDLKIGKRVLKYFLSMFVVELQHYRIGDSESCFSVFSRPLDEMTFSRAEAIRCIFPIDFGEKV